MKTKFLTLALFGVLTFALASCAEEEIAPSNDIQLKENSSDAPMGGDLLRDR